jgi:hypothetical protein
MVFCQRLHVCLSCRIVLGDRWTGDVSRCRCSDGYVHGGCGARASCQCLHETEVWYLGVWSASSVGDGCT